MARALSTDNFRDEIRSEESKKETKSTETVVPDDLEIEEDVLSGSDLELSDTETTPSSPEQAEWVEQSWRKLPLIAETPEKKFEIPKIVITEADVPDPRLRIRKTNSTRTVIPADSDISDSGVGTEAH